MHTDDEKPMLVGEDLRANDHLALKKTEKPAQLDYALLASSTQYAVGVTWRPANSLKVFVCCRAV